MKKPILLDGATGSNLMARGMPRGGCTEHPPSGACNFRSKR